VSDPAGRAVIRLGWASRIKLPVGSLGGRCSLHERGALPTVQIQGPAPRSEAENRPLADPVHAWSRPRAHRSARPRALTRPAPGQPPASRPARDHHPPGTRPARGQDPPARRGAVSSGQRAVSSVGQSASFTPRKSLVRFQYRPPHFTHGAALRPSDFLGPRSTLLKAPCCYGMNNTIGSRPSSEWPGRRRRRQSGSSHGS
jgi:hypothetical protein